MRGSKNRVQYICKRVEEIDHDVFENGKPIKHITDSWNNIATDINKKLNIKVDRKTGELLTQPKVSYRYYAKLMEDYRNGIKSLNRKHHAIERNINGFLRKYKGAVKGIEQMLDPDLPIQTLRENLIKLRAESRTGSDLRKDLLKLQVEHHAYYLFETKGAIKDWISDDNKKKLKEKLNSQIKFNPNWIKELTETLLTKEKPTLPELAIGVSLATGRRLTEVMKTATFRAVDDSTLLFSGQLKTKNRKLFEDIKAYEIPTLINSEIVCKALKRIRKETRKEVLKYTDVRGDLIERTLGDGDNMDYYHNEAVSTKYGSRFNRAIKALFRNGHLKFKDCRALYTEITYTDHSNDGESRTAYRHRVLGHSLIETQMHYDAFTSDESVKTIEVIESKNTDENSADVQKALLDYLKQYDEDINGYIRSPRFKVIHEWLKEQVSNGLPYESITASYIRKHCLFDGKQTNFNTIQKYLSNPKNPSIKIELFVPPKPKPTNKLDKAIAELEEELQEKVDRTEEIEDLRQELENEKERITERLEEIDTEDEELELEEDELPNKIEDLEQQIKELKQQRDEEENDIQQEEEAVLEDEPEEKEIDWPEPSKIEVTAKKVGKEWHAEATVNGKVFSVEQPGTKTQAVKDVRSAYKRYVEEL